MEENDVPLESISLWLPLPYRVLLLSIIGVWLFAFNLHYFQLVHIDISPFLRYARGSSEQTLHRSVYQVALLLSSIFLANLFLFWSLTGGSPELIIRYEALPMMLFVMLLGVIMWPLGNWHSRGRWRFLRMFRRILTGGLDSHLRFADVLLADALTSYAKVLGDAALVFCMYFSSHSSATHPFPNRMVGGPFLSPAFIALPYLCRFRQCITEYLRAADKGLPVPERRPHLFNAAKYASAFPVIIIGAMLRGGETEHFTSGQLSCAWYAAVVVNSLYSFYWDVTMDWDLTLLGPRRNGDYPYGLRKHRHYLASKLYYLAIAIDLVLRFTWSVKLSPHLDFIGEMEGGIFLLELLEVFRRWVWVFFRVEKEMVTNRESGGYLGVLEMEEGSDGLELDEFKD